jgi:hypothetical protein
VLPRVDAARYVLPLREGGSLPAVIEGADGRMYVAKFRAAGQGPRALVAEVIGGELARAAGLRMPELVVLALAPGFGGTDGDPEIVSLLSASTGENLGLAFLSGALPFDPAARTPVDATLASTIVALDILISNVDRSARNPNLLWVGGELWLIDHGAALYWHHAWDGGTAGAEAPLPRVAEHVLWPWATDLAAAGATLAGRVDDAAIERAVAAVPDGWLADGGEDPAARRRAYAARLAVRRDALPRLAEEAARGR